MWVVTDLVRELSAAHGLPYSFFLSGHIGMGLMPEAMAFIYDPRVVRPLVLPGSTSQVENIEIKGRDLVRTKWIAGNFDFTLISAHLAWGSREDRLDGDRKILEILTTPTPSRFSDDPDIMVVGDVNRFGLGYTFFENVTYSAQQFLAPNIAFFDPGLNRIKEVRKSHIQGKGVPDDNPQFVSTTVAGNTSVYDVFLLTSDVDEELPGTGNDIVFGRDFGIIHFDEPGGFGFQPGAQNLSHDELKEAYSDHRPLWMRFRTSGSHSDSQTTAPAVAARYVATASGRKFHLPGCGTIAGSTIAKQWTSKSDAAATHGPCSVCKP